MDTLPIIDGSADDACWSALTWQQIDQVWLPWGDEMDSVDFHGSYKLGWSPQTNLLYGLLEVQDDVIYTDFSPGDGAEIYNFDMFEIFIDEDRSGGLHVFDSDDSLVLQYGENAENAFAYHICTQFKEDKHSDPVFYFEDLAGSGWHQVIRRDYREHFPRFTCRKEGNVRYWEFSLKVFSDDYDVLDPESSRVHLAEGKVMGITMAYNDNDTPEEGREAAIRDNFIGSASVTEEAWNDHWMNADDFAPHILVGNRSDP